MTDQDELESCNAAWAAAFVDKPYRSQATTMKSVRRLQELASPAAEALSDTHRINEFVYVTREVEADILALQSALNKALRLCDNINEFGHVTDLELYTHAETAIRSAAAKFSS